MRPQSAIRFTPEARRRAPPSLSTYESPADEAVNFTNYHDSSNISRWNCCYMFHLILNTKSYLKNRAKNTCQEFTWRSSPIGPSPFVVTGHAAFPLTRKAALLFLSYFITMYLVWRIRNSMPSWHPGERRLHCLSWCARSSPLRTERSGSVCESEVYRPSLTEERVLSGWKKEKTNENSKRSNAKWQKKRLSRGLRKCIRIREGPLYTCFTNIFSWFSCFERLP